MRRCPRRHCGWPLAYRGTVWGCTSPLCTYEKRVQPNELERMLRDVTTHRPSDRRAA